MLDMLGLLKEHPFAVEAYFKSSIVLTFSVDSDQLISLIPECLSLDTFNGHAFIALAMVQTQDLRPKGLPVFLGSDFFLIGFRIFVRYQSNEGRNLRGLYILKSETDKQRMKVFGNIFTNYNYTTIDVKTDDFVGYSTISSEKSGLYIQIKNNSEKIDLPDNSPFSSWKEARRFAGPLPFTFTYNPKSKSVLIIEGVRQNWQPMPVGINSYKVPFLDRLNLDGIRLASAFKVSDVFYQWKKGRKELWKT